ncbi:hypothetical protein K4K56_003700 [Colletotrichum sp. SAR 10_98]|nr:hypothetical protein K4K55_000127 [Colletotrichum sp. SAR 10_96]KAI8296493.1 hypothetical protein K4K56_003700 [Colletotrichum sp. SAR 10_98]
MLFLAVLLFTTVPLVSSQFLNPSQSRELWRTGQTRKVQYNTKLEKYTIALWQQAIAGGSATLGPIIVETTTGPKREFEWKVDLEELDLGASNVFFFWLFEGDKSVQGQVKKGQAFSSAFFNITDEPEPTSSSSVKSSTTRSSTSVASSSELSPTSLVSMTTEVELTTTTPEAPATTQARVLPTAQEPGPTDKTKAGDASASNVPELNQSVKRLYIRATAVAELPALLKGENVKPASGLGSQSGVLPVAAVVEGAFTNEGLEAAKAACDPVKQIPWFKKSPAGPGAPPAEVLAKVISEKLSEEFKSGLPAPGVYWW